MENQQAPTTSTENFLDPTARAQNITRMTTQQKNKGRPYVEFLCIRTYGKERQVEQEPWIFDLDTTAGTLDHVMRYSMKPGWRIVDFGNLKLDENEKGVFADTVQEHKRIYQLCASHLNINAEISNLKSATAQKIADAEKRAADAEAREKELTAEMERLKAQSLKARKEA